MKKYIVLTLITFTLQVFAQKFDKKNIYFGVDARNQFELYKTKQNALFLKNEPYNSNESWLYKSRYRSLTYTINLGYRFKNKQFVELGYTETNNHFSGFKLVDIVNFYNKFDHLYTVDIESGTDFTLRYGRIFSKKRFNVQLSLAYLFSVSEDYRYPTFPFNQIYTLQIIGKDGIERTLSFQTSDKRFVDYALRQYYHSANANVGFEYQFSRFASINYNIGYTHGFNTLAYYNVKYNITGYSEQNAINEVKGSNYYFSFGLKCHPFRFKKEKNKTFSVSK